VDAVSIRKGLNNTIWPGRCEVIQQDPLVVLDGAQNIASSRALKKAIRENFLCSGSVSGRGSGGKYKKLILVIGISSDKDLKGICAQLYGLADEIVLTKANNPRATPPEILAGYFKGKKVYLTNNVKEAREITKAIAKKKDLILVTGSLFVAGEFRNA
jgi:dihydrofolate synthase/folylpolyglutamate synthase